MEVPMKPSRRKDMPIARPMHLALLLAAPAFLASCLQPADQVLETYGSRKIVFVKEPSVGSRNNDGNIAMASNMNEFYAGTDLYSLSPISPTGNLVNLTAAYTRSTSNHNDWGAALDPEVSPDGTKLLFSMRKAGSKHWQVYEMNVDGTDLVTLTTPDAGDDVDPAYIDDNHIVFGSTRNQILDEYERRPVPQLFTGERGGIDGSLTNIRQITFNQSHDQNPFVQSSGNILYARWDHLGNPNKIPLFTVHPDGTRQFVAYGADETLSGTDLTSGQRAFMEARELSDGGIVTSMMERTSEFEGGAIAIIDLSKFSSAPQIITPSTSPPNNSGKISNALFKTPYPIMDGGTEKILVAQSAHETGGNSDLVNYDLFVMDKNGANLKLVHADPDNNDYDPVVVEPRSVKPKAYQMDQFVTDGLAKGATTGMFFDANVYSRQDNDGHLKPDSTFINSDGSKGQVKFVRVLAAVPMSAEYRMRNDVGNTEFEKQRVIGYADVRSDGSFSIEVPANTAMHVQTLDENGMMIVNQLQWINVMPGERRMCTGCHGPRDHDQDINKMSLVGPNMDSVCFGCDPAHPDLAPLKKYMSGFSNAQKVTAHPSARTDTVDFMDLYGKKTNTVQAVLNARCISCHGLSTAKDSGAGLVLEDRPDTSLNNHGTSSVYEKLSNDSTGYPTKSGSKIRYASSEGARVSPLAWVLYNKQLSGKQDQFRASLYDHSAMWSKDSTGHINPFAKENGDLLTLIEWMDMGLQFTNSNEIH